MGKPYPSVAQKINSGRVQACFHLDISSQNEIDRWVEYAFTRKVQTLELNLLGDAIPWASSDFCDFPDHFLYLNNGLSAGQSYLDFSGIRLPKFDNLTSVGALSLKGVNITDEAVEFFLHNCPFLEGLELISSGKLVNLRFIGPSLMLKHLVIEKCQDVKSIQIRNSNIVSLRISEVENLILINVPKLTEVVVIEQIYNNWSRVFSQLSCCLFQLEKFSLVTVFPQELMKDSEFPELSKLKILRMNVGAWEDHSLMVLTSMIMACPCLERFVLRDGNLADK